MKQSWNDSGRSETAILRKSRAQFEATRGKAPAKIPPAPVPLGLTVRETRPAHAPRPEVPA